MNKGELIDFIADRAEIKKTEAKVAVDAFIEAVTKTMVDGGKVTLPGFGTFSISERSARTGRNPQTGATIEIAAKKTVRFKAGNLLSEAVNN